LVFFDAVLTGVDRFSGAPTVKLAAATNICLIRNAKKFQEKYRSKSFESRLQTAKAGKESRLQRNAQPPPEGGTQNRKKAFFNEERLFCPP